eukprot:485312_1
MSSKCILLTVVVGLLVVGCIVYMQSNDTTTVGSIVSRRQSGGSTEKSASMPVYGFHVYPLSAPADLTSPETDSTDASASVANEQINTSPFLVQSNQDGSGGTLSSQNLISPHILADLESIESDELHDYSVFCDVLIYDSLGRPVYDHTNVPLNSKGDNDVDTCLKFSFPSEYHIGIKSGKWTGHLEIYRFEHGAKMWKRWRQIQKLTKVPIVEAPEN